MFVVVSHGLTSMDFEYLGDVRGCGPLRCCWPICGRWGGGGDILNEVLLGIKNKLCVKILDGAFSKVFIVHVIGVGVINVDVIAFGCIIESTNAKFDKVVDHVIALNVGV